MQRDPDAILRTHEMDPGRRTLYVEGVSDHMFLKWVVDRSLGRDTQVVTINFVNLPGHAEGGERARLIAFARIVEGSPVGIRMLADADTDRLRGRSVPSKVWLTDLRDLEAYFFREECVDKVFRLGLSTDDVDSAQLLKNALRIGRWLGVLRLLSDEKEWRLPFQITNLSRSLRYTRPQVEVHFLPERYLTTLLQNARISQQQVTTIIKQVEESPLFLGNTPDREIAHGKDVTCILQKVLAELFNVN